MGSTNLPPCFKDMELDIQQRRHENVEEEEEDEAARMATDLKKKKQRKKDKREENQGDMESEGDHDAGCSKTNIVNEVGIKRLIIFPFGLV